MNARVLLLLQITLYSHIAIFRINSGLEIINSMINQICRNYSLFYIPWTVHERSCSTLLHGISAPYLSATYFIIIEIVSQLSEPPVLVLPLRCSFRYDLRTHKRDRQIAGRDSASTWIMDYGQWPWLILEYASLRTEREKSFSAYFASCFSQRCTVEV